MNAPDERPVTLIVGAGGGIGGATARRLVGGIPDLDVGALRQSSSGDPDGMRAVGGEVKPHPLECLDAGWFARDALPEPLASYDLWGELAFAAIDGSPVAVRYDLPRTPPWRVGDV